MKPSTHVESSEQGQSGPLLRSAPIEAKVATTTRCRLCRETIVIESNFRAAAVLCPACGLEFTFDPHQEPLPVRGMRLRYDTVLEAQRRGQTRYTAHPAHDPRPASVPPQATTGYFAWTVRLVLAMAAGAVLFGGFAQRLLHR